MTEHAALTKTERLYLEAMFKRELEELVSRRDALRYTNASGETVYRSTRNRREPAET
jgi:hypothetical protein